MKTRTRLPARRQNLVSLCLKVSPSIRANSCQTRSPCLLHRWKEEDAIIPKTAASMTNCRGISIFVSHDRGLCSQCAGGKGRGQRTGNFIECLLSHSETIIVYLCLHSLWAGARSVSQSKMRGACPGASSRLGQVGGPT